MLYVNARAIIERETELGTEILLQYRERAGEPRTLELPGGRLDPYEPILEALRREVQEETGLHVTAILDETHRRQWTGTNAAVECLTPFFVYQTVRGPVDSIGFYFRCHAEGTLTTAGDGATGHTWVLTADLRQTFRENPDAFDWLTQGALHYYLNWLEQRSC